MSDDSNVLDDTDMPGADDDSAVFSESVPVEEGVLRIYSVGELTVVGFGGEDVPDETCIAAYREQLDKLTEEHGCKTLACDLSGVRFVPSGMLGVLISLRKKGINIELYNPSDDVQEVLRITKLEQMFQMKQVDL